MHREKIQRLQALADDRGVIAALAAGHRGSLRLQIAEAASIPEDEVADGMLSDFKVVVSEELTPHASAILLDPEVGAPAAEARADGTGLLLCYAQSGYDKDRPGRMPDLVPGASVRRLKELGADGVRALIHYTSYEEPERNDAKLAFVERIGSECQAEGLPFLLELIAYDEADRDPQGFEFAQRKPRIVTGAVRELSKERYGVDLLGVEIPINPRFAQGSRFLAGEPAYTKDRALEYYREAAEAAERPMLYSSGGAPADQLTESLHWAAEAGVNFAGVLCGRAAWGGAADVFAARGSADATKWLAGQGARNLDAVNAALANAGSWYSFYGADSAQTLAD